ncbi:MAG: DUF1816 domain-containing protein [Cyanobacteria bacterium RI_101]|nr:DUF1816 domain-containing protein [Cyanobacteria bacterium RI_101]
MKEFVLTVLNQLGLAVWVEVVTQTPRCTYYFGPFLNTGEAESAYKGYLEDLSQEGAQGIGVQIKRCRPQNLTIFEDSLGKEPSQYRPAVSLGR